MQCLTNMNNEESSNRIISALDVSKYLECDKLFFVFLNLEIF